MPAAGGDQPVAAGDTRDFVAVPTGTPPPPSTPVAWPPPPPSGTVPDPPGPGAPPGRPVSPPPPAGRPGPAQLELSFSGVYLLTDGPRGPRATPGHDLRVDDDGLRLVTADGAPVWSVRWSEVEQLVVPERSALPDGHEGVVVEVTTAGGATGRCLVPAGHWWALGGAFEALARSRGVGAARERRLPWLVTAVLVLLAAGAVAALLLASGHLVRF